MDDRRVPVMPEIIRVRYLTDTMAPSRGARGQWHSKLACLIVGVLRIGPIVQGDKAIVQEARRLMRRLGAKMKGIHKQ